ncbi:MAG: shikimate dehydrogenase [Verrucomicrobiales bacterium]|nr:shikimate dehydrogenase [Verrucomicrobiales bacterium]
MPSEPKDAYTIDDLRDWENATGDLDPPARLAVFGDPVIHSRSPQMHNPALAEGGKNCQYVRLHIGTEDLREALNLLKEKNFIGTNVTIPHKGEVFAAVDDMTEVARLTHSVNTVLVDDGQLIGHNTDAPGLEQAIREEFSVDLTDLRVMVLGAGGGAGRAACIQAAMDRSERLVLVNRTFEKANALKKEIEPMYAKSERLLGPVDRLAVIPHEVKYLERELKHIDLIINATSLGMKVSDPVLIPAHLLQPHHLIFDMVYAPPQTRLMRDAVKAGARAANGLNMLLWQGAHSYEFWFNEEAPVEAMRKGLKESFNNAK